MSSVNFLLRGISTARDPVRPVLAALVLVAGAIIVSPFLLLAAAFLLATKFRRKSFGRLFSSLPRNIKRTVTRSRAQLSLNLRRLARHIYAEMMTTEAALIVAAANKVDDVRSWYVPTPLWPEFSAIKRPRLTCVPDVVIQEFPIGFSRNDGIKEALHRVDDSIGGGSHFVTYSEHIKTSVLVSDRAVKPDAVHVIRHAPNSLSDRLAVSGFSSPEAASTSLAQALAVGGLGLISGPLLGPRYERAHFSFIFYASQFRPSKNIATLLRAYDHLLRQRFIGHKLILTGQGWDSTVLSLIKHYGLERDVLCLYGLTEQQLAAFYKLAELAVNPSLSEGGMPFTFSEALSVGTPVLMGDIAVTREIITDPDLADDTLFDPYDWRALADKIEWALDNKRALYAKQRKFYDDVLSKRTWDDVVQEHLAILDAIAEPAAP